jgi:hypothetical protein
VLCITNNAGDLTGTEVSDPSSCAEPYLLETYSPSLTVADYEALFQALLEPIALIGVFYIILKFIINR